MVGSSDGMIPRVPSRVDHLDYTGEGLTGSEVPAAPLALVTEWVDAARTRQLDRGDVPEPLSIAVATVDATGQPDVRTVLMRFLDERGPGFVTSLDSAKSRQLREVPKAAATLTWPAMFRAVRFRGAVEPLAATELDAYFAGRPRGSQISAWVSHQSQPVERREALEQAWAETEARFAGQEVPRPPAWGGWRIVCDALEVWAGRRNRLHDRFRWTRVGEGGLDEPGAWRRERLQP